jgi:PPOX class probable F420-dependent enzyme
VPEIDPVYRTSHVLDDNVRAILAEPRRATLATVSPDDVPHAVPTWFLFDGERFLTSATTSSRKARNVSERATARILVEHPSGWVSASGPARLITGDGTRALQERIMERYLTEQGRKHFLDASGFPDDGVIELTAEKWMSWTVMGSYTHMRDAGFSDEEIAGWLVPLARRDP